MAPTKGRRSGRFTITGSCLAGSLLRFVLAEEWEIARYAASLIRVEYQEKRIATDLDRERGKAFTLSDEAMSLAKPRGDAGKALAASKARHEAEYFIPSSITIRWSFMRRR